MGKLKKEIPKDEMCANCGTDLHWWVNQPRSKIYHARSDEYFCSKKCMKEYHLPYDYEIIK